MTNPSPSPGVLPKATMDVLSDLALDLQRQSDNRRQSDGARGRFSARDQERAIAKADLLGVQSAAIYAAIEALASGDAP